MFSHFFLSIVCLFFFDLRIHSHSFLTYDPDKHIGLVQRRHDHKLVLAMILLTNGSPGIIINRIFNIKLLIASYGILKLFIHCLFSIRNPLYFISTKIQLHCTSAKCHGVRINLKLWCFYKNYIDLIRYSISQVYNAFFYLQFN